MQQLQFKMHRLGGVIAVFVLVGCSPKPDETAGETDPGTSTGALTGASETSATDTAPTTTGSATTPSTSGASDAMTSGTGDATETGDGTTGDASGSTGEATSGTTGDPDDGLEAACMAVCQQIEACIADPGPLVEECIDECPMTFGGPPECTSAATKFWACVATMTCEQIEKFLEDGPTDACIEEMAAVDAVCEECGLYGEGNDTMCAVGRDCGEVLQEFQCDAGGGCTCFEDGAPGAMCEVPGFCGLDIDVQAQTAQDCCGWDWPG